MSTEMFPFTKINYKEKIKLPNEDNKYVKEYYNKEYANFSKYQEMDLEELKKIAVEKNKDIKSLSKEELIKEIIN